MSHGRSTTRFSVRIDDKILENFKLKAKKKGLPFTVYVRTLMYKELGIAIKDKPEKLLLPKNYVSNVTPLQNMKKH
ncbi:MULTISPECIES: hypothetical protein [Dehalococcoides]|uniref:CopG family transcriptional regulator n=1 Tax=Dehalococcoides mccartyi TaxID=61435 RepID=A0AB38Z7V3_9CHLR|nr:hypothetical protein [Dehalococcoides mccartyi]WRO06648.1 hypothetical protein VLL09_04465 [Dehalococcoides mccartyi]